VDPGSTVAAARTTTLLHRGHRAAAAMTGGFHSAFIVLGLIGMIAVPITFALVRRRDLDAAVAATAATSAAQPERPEVMATAAPAGWAR
jgi:hypothetical protein